MINVDDNLSFDDKEKLYQEQVSKIASHIRRDPGWFEDKLFSGAVGEWGSKYKRYMYSYEPGVRVKDFLIDIIREMARQGKEG